MNVNFQPMKKIIMPMMLAATTLGVSTLTSCQKYENEVLVNPETEFPIYPEPYKLPLDSARLAKLDSLAAITQYKVDSINKSSGDQNALDSLLTDTNNKIIDIINSK